MINLFIILLILIFLLVVVNFLSPEYKNPFTEQVDKLNKPHKCESCSSKVKLDDLFNPAYNMKEVAKQSILLEDHLVHPTKRCRDCIAKHFLSICALLSEAVQLSCGNSKKYPLLDESIDFYNYEYDDWFKHQDNDEDIIRIAGEIRDMRKKIVARYYFNEDDISA